LVEQVVVAGIGPTPILAPLEAREAALS